MALKTFVKVGSITNLSDARYCAAMGVDMLGFQAVEGHENFIPAPLFQEIRGWVTGPQVVAEVYGVKDLTELQTIIENYRPDFLELGTQEFDQLNGTLPLPFILALKKQEGIKGSPAFILADEEPNIPPSSKLLLKIDSKEDTEKVLQGRADGIALKGSVELKPGLKDYQELSEILEILETD